MLDLDERVRLAAFDWLDGQRQLHGETLPRSVLAQGFEIDGRRVPLVGPAGRAVRALSAGIVITSRAIRIPASEITRLPWTEGLVVRVRVSRSEVSRIGWYAVQDARHKRSGARPRRQTRRSTTRLEHCGLSCAATVYGHTSRRMCGCCLCAMTSDGRSRGTRKRRF